MPKNTPVRKPVVSDAEYQEIERLVNCSIHELVFALKHTDQAIEHCSLNARVNPAEVFEDAQNCLMTVASNVARLEEIIQTAINR